jgi:hypothetical protein
MDPSHSDSDSDLGSTTDEEESLKKLWKRELLTTGFATLAAVHAGHNISKSLKKHREGNKQLHKDETGSEKGQWGQRMENNLRDVASAGLAALGIRNALKEWQEAAEKLEEISLFQQKSKHHAEKRAQRRTRSQDAPS